MRQIILAMLLFSLALVGCTLSNATNQSVSSATETIQFLETQGITATPDPFELTATSLIIGATRRALPPEAIEATADYWATIGVTQTIDAFDVQATQWAIERGVTATYRALHCQQFDYDRWVIFYDGHVEAHDYIFTREDSSYFEWICDVEFPPTYFLAISLLNDSQPQIIRNQLEEALSVVAELSTDNIQNDFPPYVQLKILWQNRRNPPLNRESDIFIFDYEDAITAIENGLTGQDLLDELGIDIVYPE